MDVTITLRGTRPLIMHNGKLADPLDPDAKTLKKLNGKKQKTEDDYLAIAEKEFKASLYLDAALGVFIPADNVHKCLVEAARKRKKGKDIEIGFLVKGDVCPLAYRGPKTPDELWAKRATYEYRKGVRVGRSRIIRSRPMFSDWALEVQCVLDTSVMDLADFQLYANIAGSQVGLGERRPRFGLFDAAVIESS